MTVNKKQSIVLWVALVSGVVMGALPPWTYTTDYSMGERSEKSERSAGYAFLGKPPQPAEGLFTHRLSEPYRKLGAGVRIDATRLLIQYVVLAIIGGGLLLMLKSKPSAAPSPQSMGAVNTAIPRTAKATTNSTPRDDSDDDEDDPPTHQGISIRDTQAPTAERGYLSRASGSGWRLQSFKAVGFRLDPWILLFAALGGAAHSYVVNFESLVISNAAAIAHAGEFAIESAVGCFMGGLIGSYVSWRVGGRSRDTLFWGGILGIALAVTAAIWSNAHGERNHHQRTDAAKWNADYLSEHTCEAHSRAVQDAAIMPAPFRAVPPPPIRATADRRYPSRAQPLPGEPPYRDALDYAFSLPRAKAELKRQFDESKMDSFDWLTVQERFDRDIAAGRWPDIEKIIADVKAGH